MYLQQYICSVVEAHDERAHPSHVIHVREGDQGDGGNMVHEHEQEVLQKTSCQDKPAFVYEEIPVVPLQSISHIIVQSPKTILKVVLGDIDNIVMRFFFVISFSIDDY